MIPPDASLAASGYLPHHFARRKVIFYVNASIVKIFPFDYVLYYYKGTDLLRADPDTRRIISEDYEVEAGKGRFTLFRRKQIPYTPQQRSILDTLPR